MKQMLIILYVVVGFSCTDYGTIKNEYKNNCEIKFLSKKELPADDETSILTSYIQYIDNEEISRTLFVLNKYNNSIYFYDYDSLKVKKKITFDKEGANGVGLMQGFYYINSDSIFVFCENTQTVYLTNERAEVKWRKIMPSTAIGGPDFMPANPYIQTNIPLEYMDKKLILQGTIGETLYETAINAPITSIYDIANDTVLFANNYPEQYQKYNWGGWGYRMSYYDVNKEKNKIVISFPQDHYLYVYSLKDKISKKYYAGSNLISKIDAYDEKKEFVPDFNGDRVRAWFYSNPSYRTVVYDKYRKLYYRIALLPKEKRMQDFYNAQPVILIVLDENFNYLGEGLLPDDVDLNVTNCFASIEGLNIQVLTDNENFYTFYQFNVEINE